MAATEHVRPLKGGAQAQLMRAADGELYAVKFVNNPQHTRVLANEWIAARLATSLGLPVPGFEQINVAPQLIATSPNLVLRSGSSLLPCSSGLQFGSRFPIQDLRSPIYDCIPPGASSNVQNLRDFAGILMFDKWTCNCDNRQVIYCRADTTRNLRMFMIDQGFCFNAEMWNFPDAPTRGLYYDRAVYSSIKDWQSFEPWLDRLEHLDISTVVAAGSDMPTTWQAAGAPLERLLSTIFKRRFRVRELLWATMRSLIPCFGGRI